MRPYRLLGVASYGRVTWEAPAQTELRPTAPGLLAAHGLQLRLGIENENENERDRRGPT